MKYLGDEVPVNRMDSTSESERHTRRSKAFHLSRLKAIERDNGPLSRVSSQSVIWGVNDANKTHTVNMHRSNTRQFTSVRLVECCATERYSYDLIS